MLTTERNVHGNLKRINMFAFVIMTIDLILYLLYQFRLMMYIPLPLDVGMFSVHLSILINALGLGDDYAANLRAADVRRNADTRSERWYVWLVRWQMGGWAIADVLMGLTLAYNLTW